MPFIISGFRSLEPTYLRSQRRTLDWLCAAHTQAEVTRAALEGRVLDEARVRSRMHAALTRFGCGEDKIATRGYELADCDHTNWREMPVYPLEERPEGAGMLARTQAFEKIADFALERLYAPDDAAPSELVHVTCTGYVSPSPAQKLVARRGWGARTRVTHAYHMGCYAAFPALRMACGSQSHPPSAPGARARTSVVHTEVCSLHVNPSNHEPEQIVVQSLFADGFITYDVTRALSANSPDSLSRDTQGRSFEILAELERIIPDSDSAMTWRCSDWGMQMTLARDVPERLGAALLPFVTDLLDAAGLPSEQTREALFAVHPGGPRILDRVQDALRLADTQMQHSRRVLRERGNMSSATLPHIWMAIANDSRLPAGVPVISLAFGPGLTLCGAVLRATT